MLNGNVETKVVTLKELDEFLMPLSNEEYVQLEKSILLEGCRDSLITWERNDAELVLVDGHNRYKICTIHDIPFCVKRLTFSDIEEVKEWMIDNQMGRRNLNPDQLSYYRGLKYLALRKRKGGYENIKSKGQNEPSTSNLLSANFNVSESTIKRDSKFAEGLNIIGATNPQLKSKILLGEVKVKKSDIQVLSDAKEPSNIKIQSKLDLWSEVQAIKDIRDNYRLKTLRDELSDEVETSIKQIESNRRERTNGLLHRETSDLLEREGKFIEIEEMILSAINRAIIHRDMEAISEIRKLIERLELELFS
jgi:hypothetical protein